MNLSRSQLLYFAGFSGLYFCALLSQCARHGLDTSLFSYMVYTLRGTADQAMALFGPSDAGSYIKAAQAILMGEDMRQQWYFNLWPPGMMILEALIIHLVPAHFALTLYIVTMAAWAISMGVTAATLRNLSGRSLMSVSLFGVFALPTFRNYLFFSGIFMSESLSISFLTPGLLLLCNAMLRRSLPAAIAAGLLLALATFFRAQCYLATLTLIGLFAAMPFVLWVILALRRRRLNRLWLPAVLAATLAYVGTVGPYVVWHRMGLVHMEYTYAMPWRTPPAIPDFVTVGGGEVLCQADPVTCAKMRALQPGASYSEDRKAEIHVLRTHPWTVLKLKTPYLVKSFLGVYSWLDVMQDRAQLAENVFFAFVLLLGITGCALLFNSPFFQTMLLVQVAVWVGTLSAPFLLMQFEPRYFYIGKVTSLVAALCVTSDAIRREKDLRFAKRAERHAQDAQRDQHDAQQAQRRQDFAQQQP